MVLAKGTAFRPVDLTLPEPSLRAQNIWFLSNFDTWSQELSDATYFQAFCQEVLVPLKGDVDEESTLNSGVSKRRQAMGSEQARWEAGE